MGSRDRTDLDMNGQFSIYDQFKPPERLFAVSRIFARARKEMNLTEQKTFVYALSELKFTEEATSNYVKLDKKTLAGIIGMKSDADHLSTHLYEAVKELPKHSYIEINQKDLDFQSSGFIVTAITRFKNTVRLRFNDEYMKLFTGLSRDYITMWSSDIFQMNTKRSVQFYEFLRQSTDTREEINDIALGIKAFKEMFDIPMDGDGSYMRKDGHFDRAAFEKRIIEPLCNDLKGCKMINLLVQPDGKYYVKEKKGGRVNGYRFFWTFNARPGLEMESDAEELPEKKETAKSGRKQRPAEKKNRFNNYDGQRDYDYNDLESKLLNADS